MASYLLAAVGRGELVASTASSACFARGAHGARGAPRALRAPASIRRSAGVPPALADRRLQPCETPADRHAVRRRSIRDPGPRPGGLSLRSPPAPARPRRCAPSHPRLDRRAPPGHDHQRRDSRRRRARATRSSATTAQLGQPAARRAPSRTRRSAVARARPGGARLMIGDMSARCGGEASGHHSHRTGRDADLLIYVTTPDGRPSRRPGFVRFGPDGLGRGREGQVRAHRSRARVAARQGAGHARARPTCSGSSSRAGWRRR